MSVIAKAVKILFFSCICFSAIAATDPFLVDYYKQPATYAKAGMADSTVETSLFTGVANLQCGGKHRTDGYQYEPKSGKLTILEGWFNHDAKEARFGKKRVYQLSPHYERVVSGDFYGKGCDTILLYNTQDLSAELWNNKAQTTPFLWNKTAFKRTLVNSPKGNEISTLFSLKIINSIDWFVNKYGGSFILLAEDLNQDAIDDLLFIAVKAKDLHYMIVFAGHPERRKDNLQFNSISLGGSKYSEALTIKNAAFSHSTNLIRIGNIDKDLTPELLIMKKNPYTSDMELNICKFDGQQFGQPTYRKFDAVFLEQALASPFSANLIDMDGDGGEDFTLFGKAHQGYHAWWANLMVQR